MEINFVKLNFTEI